MRTFLRAAAALNAVFQAAVGLFAIASPAGAAQAFGMAGAMAASQLAAGMALQLALIAAVLAQPRARVAPI